MTEFGPDSVSLHFSPGQGAEPGNTVADLKRIFGAAPAVKTKLVVRKHDFSSAQTASERRAIHEQILAINRRLENLKGSLSDLTVRLGAAVTLPPTERA